MGRVRRAADVVAESLERGKKAEGFLIAKLPKGQEGSLERQRNAKRRNVPSLSRSVHWVGRTSNWRGTLMTRGTTVVDCCWHRTGLLRLYVCCLDDRCPARYLASDKRE